MEARVERSGGETLWRWQGVDDAQVALLRRSVASGACECGQRAGRAPVWLLDGSVLKLQGAPRGLVRPWRPSRLRRAAAGHWRLQPLVTPRPLALIERRSGGRLRSAGLLMTRLDGVDLRTAWDDPAARAALAPVLVALVARGVIHGDIHSGNLLWDGGRWGVIDLDSLRHALHGLVRRRNWLRMWSALLAQIPDLERMAAVHVEACTLAGHRDHARRWRRIVERAEAERRRRGWEALSSRGPAA